MGRKARATKGQKPTLVPTSIEVLTSAAEVNPINMNSDPLQPDMVPTAKKKLKTPGAIVRRSKRFQSDLRNQQIEPVFQQIHISESENENEKEDGPPVHEENHSHGQTSDKTERSSQKDTPGVADIKYKSMYINSQKKIENLLEENTQLNKALEHAIGKINVFEKQSEVYSQVIDVIASLSKVNENLSAHIKHDTSLNDDEEGGARASKKKKS